MWSKNRLQENSRNAGWHPSYGYCRNGDDKNDSQVMAVSDALAHKAQWATKDQKSVENGGKKILLFIDLRHLCLSLLKPSIYWLWAAALNPTPRHAAALINSQSAALDSSATSRRAAHLSSLAAFLLRMFFACSQPPFFRSLFRQLNFEATVC